MKVYINDHSINGQATTEDEALDILLALAKVALESRSIAFEKRVFRTREFRNKEIIKGISIKEILDRLFSKKIHSDKLEFILRVLLSQPFTKFFHTKEEDSLVCTSGNCLKETCFDEASESISGALVISAYNSNNFSEESFTLRSSIYGEKVILNTWSIDCIRNLSWLFDHNPKHHKASRSEGGVTISAMDLDTHQAQKTLSNGVKIGNRVYGFCSGFWYQFHCHNPGQYHGFKIELAKNNTEHMKALETFERLEYRDHGQIFITP